ncbi:hypothetical protein U0070_009443 [Myodes glareolus]|uniref:NADH dehydrogenase subunit 2 n=1 Tax=Myodes glareolus TaxID=447135 RepID=A0AAW0HY64_MYOGA
MHPSILKIFSLFTTAPISVMSKTLLISLSGLGTLGSMWWK